MTPSPEPTASILHAALRLCSRALTRWAWGLRRMACRFSTPARPPLALTPPPFPPPGELGRTFPDYRRTFAFEGAYIDRDHRAIASLPVAGGLIRTQPAGFLRRADALTLYELAYFCDGDLLELGSAWGLSTTFLCRAALAAGRGTRVFSVEIDPGFRRATRQALRTSGLEACYRGCPGDAHRVVERLIGEGRRFGFVFVDFDHSYRATRRLCERLHGLLRPGGLVLFHDFNDERNLSLPEEYGIYRAVAEVSAGNPLHFLGVIGCCGLFRSNYSDRP